MALKRLAEQFHKHHFDLQVLLHLSREYIVQL